MFTKHGPSSSDELPVEATLKADVVDSAVDHFPQTDPFQVSPASVCLRESLSFSLGGCAGPDSEFSFLGPWSRFGAPRPSCP